MVTHVEKNFNTGTVATYFDSVIDADAATSLSATAALNGTAKGLLGQLDAGNSSFALTDTTYTNPGSNELRLRMRFSTLGITNVPATATGGGIFVVTLNSSTTSGKIVEISLTWNINQEFVLRFIVFRDNDIFQTLQYSQTMTDGEHCIEWKVVRETADGNNDGISTIFIDGVEVDSSTADQNFNSYNDTDRFQVSGAISTNADGFTGDIYVDELIVDNDSDANLGCETASVAGQLTLAEMPNPCDVDADGTYLYIAALDSNSFPVVIKFSSALNTDGSVIFASNAGTNIGVRCSKLDSQNVWIAGEFDGTNTVEKSEDAGVSFDVKDDGTFAAMTGFTIGPNNDSTILACDENGDYFLTIDNGATWETVTASGTVLISLDRLDTNPDETIGGSDSSPTNEVLYSPDVMRGGQGIVLEASNTVKGVIIG